MDAHKREVHARVEFKRIRLHPPYLLEAQHILDVEREVGRATKGLEQSIVQITGPSHTGKSTIIKDYCERVSENEAPPPGRHPVLHVTLTSKSSVGSLGNDILKAMAGCALPATVVTDLVNMRPRERVSAVKRALPEIMHVATKALRNAGTELLVLDEAHHLSPSETAAVTNQNVTEAIKWIAIQGVCPVVCVGTKRLRGLLSADVNSQVANRTVESIHLDPIDFDDDKGFDTFCGYLDALDDKLVEHDIFPKKSDLIQEKWPDCFYDVSKGVIGRVSRLVEAAAVSAIRAGRSRIELQNLDVATRTWAMKTKVTDYNPWTEKGPRDVQDIRRKALNVE
ncbi:MAG: TniB family NTP-binding protein [Roseiarcus sp.]|jgi:molybdopterin-guanine dinucleotide biosynthesis protein